MRAALVSVPLLLLACHRAPIDENNGAPDGGGVAPSCASTTMKASLHHVDLVFMLDQSASMGDGMGNGDPALKWNPVKAALGSFFADAASQGVSASLQYFPAPITDMCNSSVYYAPDVPLRALPDATTFAASLMTHHPAGQTPTLPAMIGARDYAKDTATADPDAHVAMVLVTDGQPDACMSSVINVSTEVEKVAATIPTYVIGVLGAGDDLSSLDAIAMHGGTTKATIVATGNPTQTSADFVAALQEIRGITLSCKLPVPMPPAGYDVNKVNVVYTPSVGTVQTIGYDHNCVGGTGWHFTDMTGAFIQLCDATCNTIRADHAAQLDVVLGCKTRGVILF